MTRSSTTPFAGTSLAWLRNANLLAASAVTDETTNTVDIFTIDAEDGSVKQISNKGWEAVRSLIWTKDGDGLFAITGESDGNWDSQIWQLSYPSGEVRRVVSDLNVYGAALGLSPTGSDLLVLQAQHISNIWIAPTTDLTGAKQITQGLLGKKSGWNALEWVDDGKIVFTAFNDASESIWEMSADGKNVRQIIPDGRTNGHPSLSRDGGEMVFDSNRSGSWEIWAARRDGSRMLQLTTGGNNSQPHISPDGSSVVFSSGRDGSQNIRRMPISGGAPVSVGDIDGRWPRYSPDGRSIACVCRTDGRPRLAVLSTESGGVIKGFDYPASANFNNGIRWTPDGQFITYRDWNNGIWKQSIDGGGPQRIEGLPEEKLFSYGWSKDGKTFAFSRGTEIRDVVLINGVR